MDIFDEELSKELEHFNSSHSNVQPSTSGTCVNARSRGPARPSGEFHTPINFFRPRELHYSDDSESDSEDAKSSYINESRKPKNLNVSGRYFSEASPRKDDEIFRQLCQPLGSLHPLSSLSACLNEYSSEEDSSDSDGYCYSPSFEEKGCQGPLQTAETHSSEQGINQCLAHNANCFELLTQLEEDICKRFKRAQPHEPYIFSDATVQTETTIDLDKFAAPYFSITGSDVSKPEPNKDVLKKIASNEFINYNFAKPLRWSRDAKKQLARCVSQKKQFKDAEEGFLQRLESMDHNKHLIPTCNTVPISNPEKSDGCNWENIANSLKYDHTANDCRNLWYNYLQPAFKKEQFSNEERSNLLRIVKENNEEDWERIATELGTGRSGLQCFAFFNEDLSNVRKSEWTKDENKRLSTLVGMYTVDGETDWDRVVFNMSGRGLDQVVNHWKIISIENRKRGRLSKQEEMILINKLEGLRPKDYFEGKYLSKLIPGRSAAQLRSHIFSRLTDTFGAHWTSQEDALLMSLVKKFKTRRWWKIRSYFYLNPNRNTRQLKSRYYNLKMRESIRRPLSKARSKALRECIKRSLWISGTAELPEERRTRFPGPRTCFGRKRSLRDSTDLELEEFFRVNYIEERQGTRPGSLNLAFTPTGDEVCERAEKFLKQLGALRAEIAVPDYETIRGENTFSNRDKRSLNYLRNYLTREATRMGFDDPTLFQRCVNSSTSNEYFQPNVETVRALRNIAALLSDDPRQNNSFEVSDSGPKSDVVVRAQTLWTERLKTVFLKTLQMDPSDSVGMNLELKLGESNEATNKDGDENIEEVKKKAVGRPKKNLNKRKAEECVQPKEKRKYERTGKYIVANNPLVTPRKSSRKSLGTLPSEMCNEN